MGTLIIILLLLWLLLWLFPELLKPVKRQYRRLTEKRIAAIFENNYLESKSFYMYRFRAIPCTSCVDDIDVTKAFEYIKIYHEKLIADIYQACYFNWEESKQQFSKTVFVLTNKIMIELGGYYAKILYPGNRYGFANELVQILSNFKLPEKEEDFEINIISLSKAGLELKQLDIKPTTLDLSLYYNDDFGEVDEIIRKRLNQENDKGIILLHGLPGTGKTTYLRHLIGGLKKKVLFVAPSVAGNLMDPEFIDLLIDNPNAVLIIEDAENIMMDRKHNSNSSVSNLLNLSDGLLSDCLSVQIICTFNSSVNMIDQALMRKGRLIAKYEFGKLDIVKAEQLSKRLGFNSIIMQPMTIAEIANQQDKDYEMKRIEVVGFKRQEVMMN
jgi:hypothetical protein